MFRDQDDAGTGIAKLYSSLAAFYDVMYEEVMDYDQQYVFCDEFLSHNHCRNVLELGCGSGHLTHRLENRYDVTGVDVSGEMLALAGGKTGAVLVRADICTMDLEERFDAVVMLGRTLAHMTADDDLRNALSSVYEHLNDDGIFIVDSFLKNAIQERDDEEHYDFDGLEIRRENQSHVLATSTGTWRWSATYTVRDAETGEEQVFEDEMMLRAFSRDELANVLQETGFTVLRQYANVHFEETAGSAFVTVARKNT